MQTHSYRVTTAKFDGSTYRHEHEDANCDAEHAHSPANDWTFSHSHDGGCNAHEHALPDRGLPAGVDTDDPERDART